MGFFLRRRMLIVFSLVGISLLGFFLLSNLHHKRVENGEFWGLRIGDTKSETLARLRTNANFNRVGFLYLDGALYSFRNLESFEQLDDNSKFELSTGSLFGGWLSAEIEDGVVSNVRSDRWRWRRVLWIGQSSDEAYEVVRRLVARCEGIVLHIGQGDSEYISLHAVEDSPQILDRSDLWTVKPIDTEIILRLIFVDEKLAEIDYRNYFVELP